MPVPDKSTLETATLIRVEDLWALTAVAMRFYQLNPDQDPPHVHERLPMVIGKAQRVLEEYGVPFGPQARFPTPRQLPPNQRGWGEQSRYPFEEM